MSTILKTLKKLEEEKSVLEKGLDLKELVLQDEENIFLNSIALLTCMGLFYIILYIL